jgi:hypothetical protein
VPTVTAASKSTTAATSESPATLPAAAATKASAAPVHSSTVSPVAAAPTLSAPPVASPPPLAGPAVGGAFSTKATPTAFASPAVVSVVTVDPKAAAASALSAASAHPSTAAPGASVCHLLLEAKQRLDTSRSSRRRVLSPKNLRSGGNCVGGSGGKLTGTFISASHGAASRTLRRHARRAHRPTAPKWTETGRQRVASRLG